MTSKPRINIEDILNKTSVHSGFMNKTERVFRLPKTKKRTSFSPKKSKKTPNTFSGNPNLFRSKKNAGVVKKKFKFKYEHQKLRAKKTNQIQRNSFSRLSYLKKSKNISKSKEAPFEFAEKTTTEDSHIRINKILNQRFNNFVPRHPKSIDFSKQKGKLFKENSLFSNSRGLLAEVDIQKPSSRTPSVRSQVGLFKKGVEKIFKSQSPNQLNRRGFKSRSKLERYLAVNGKSPLSSLDISATRRSERCYTTERKRRSPHMKKCFVTKTLEFKPKRENGYVVNQNKVKKLEEIASEMNLSFKENYYGENSKFLHKKDFDTLVKFVENLCDENAFLEEKLTQNYKATQSLLESCQSLNPSKCKKNIKVCQANEKEMEKLKNLVEIQKKKLEEKDQKLESLENQVIMMESELEEKEEYNNQSKLKESEYDDSPMKESMLGENEDCTCDYREKFNELTLELEELKSSHAIEIVNIYFIHKIGKIGFKN